MRKNEYESLDDFIYEYSVGREFSWQNVEHKERYMGLEFEYGGVFYRLCREPYEEGYTPILPNGKPGLYNVMIMHCEQFGYPAADEFESIGWYDSMESLLEDCVIGEKKFKEVIMTDDTRILGKD